MDALEYLYQAAGKQKGEIDEANPFSTTGFDNGAPRLGWVIPPSWEMIESVLKRLDEYFEGKNEFVFIGMGGSINGIKTLLALNKDAPVYCLDSLDPAAGDEILDRIKDKEKTLVIPITKSGTTTETQLLARTLKEVFTEHWDQHFLWLSDRPSFKKLDSLGWESCLRDTIQVDGKSDIGGRFSSPHSLVFLLPLYLVMNQDKKRIKELYLEYLSRVKQIEKDAYNLAAQYKEHDPAFFSILVKEKIREEITTWITQLFQESLGSKKDGFYVKTIVGETKEKGFLPVRLTFDSESMHVYLMGLMHYLHIFVASFAFYKGVNFVNQPCVEEYKRAMKALRDTDLVISERISLERVMKEIKKKLSPSTKFIEILLYFHPKASVIEKLKALLKKHFPDKKVFVFLGSDWNHHSYQAAFGDIYSIYAILVLKDYLKKVPGISAQTLENNVSTLRRICEATYKTLQDKALYLSL